MSVVTTLLRSAGRSGAENAEAIGAEFDALWRTCRGTWPHVVMDPVVFAAYLGERLPEGPIHEGLTTLRAPELYLCCACAAGLRTASMWDP